MLSPAFYRQEMYKTLGRRFPTLEDFLVGSQEAFWRQQDANNLLAQLWTVPVQIGSTSMRVPDAP